MHIRVVVQQRHRFFLEGLTRLVEAEEDLDVVGAATTGADLSAIWARSVPDVAVVEPDVDEWDCCRLAATLSKRTPKVRFVGLYVTMDDKELVRARRAGIQVLLPRAGGVAPVIEAIRQASSLVAPNAFIPPATDGAANLSPREVNVLSLVGAGFTSQETALRLGISRKTVENHKQRIFAKLGVQNQAHAVAVAIRKGWISADTDLSRIEASQ
jgi:DNA-binding NarL/FixJ family response regulator